VWNLKLFDLQPKTRREDLFDRERELQELHSAIEKGYPLIALLGIRRIGKTSVLKVLANEVDGVYLDMRGLVKRDDMYMRVADAMSSNIAKMKKLLEGIRGSRSRRALPRDQMEREGFSQPRGAADRNKQEEEEVRRHVG
jgi:AAA+ ATPase superfamily predicted ATPase